jgi:ATP-dependent Clp protease ATP-binding subunit ClpC
VLIDEKNRILAGDAGDIGLPEDSAPSGSDDGREMEYAYAGDDAGDSELHDGNIGFGWAHRKSREKPGVISPQLDGADLPQLLSEIRRMQALLDEAETEWRATLPGVRPNVDADDVRKVVSEMSGVPITALGENESRRLLHMEDELKKMVVGQDEAVASVSRAIRRARTGLSTEKRPVGAFLFAGPSGSGKTQLARALATFMFGKHGLRTSGSGRNQVDSPLLRIDMSDYMERHTVSRLTGAPPGFVGYEEGGVLTEAVRKNPYRVILFDEIEKAHRDVYNVLLQVLEEGELQDSWGRTVDFSNSIIILTSNAGAREIARDHPMGFTEETGMGFGAIKSAAMEEVRRIFSPEFINRLDDVVIFHLLGEKELAVILDTELSDFASRLAAKGMTMEIGRAAKKTLLSKSIDKKFGGRMARRIVATEIEEPVARLLLEKNCPAGTRFVVSNSRDNKIRVKIGK